MSLVLFAAAVSVVTLCEVEFARATTPSGFTGETKAKGTFAAFQVFNQLSRNSLPAGFPESTWFSFEKTGGPSDVYVQSNTWLPGGSTGWHKHPGHSLIIITSGQVTQYEADCTPHVYGRETENGPTLVDSGNDVHLIRNESPDIPATGYAVQTVPYNPEDPKNPNRRIDAPAPENCNIEQP